MIRTLLKCARADERGAVAVEFAVILPVFLTILIGIFETAHYFFIASTLENAVLHASRFGITGGSGTTGTREEAILDVIAKQTFGRVDLNTLEVETLVYQNFSDVGDPEPFSDINENDTYDEGEPFSDINGNGQWDDDMAIAGLGGSGDIVLYRISHTPDSLTGFFDWATSQIPLTATVAVRNEPF